ncbi:uncharacterized protein LOC132947260 [Metopolophium dirhodum]|uniref:uncharacterized protein LOC132947260 n=1 Tax=Metopolophium dirhodum TaxID=44670 RepID=UPI0029900079|nr:uncharacterized protein LOC132947260 [Metopolophium dirhodum]XP_060873497.1 uncharacterized protein LOC132947260 [Metopolophium dirhodum]
MLVEKKNESNHYAKEVVQLDAENKSLADEVVTLKVKEKRLTEKVKVLQTKNVILEEEIENLKQNVVDKENKSDTDEVVILKVREKRLTEKVTLLKTKNLSLEEEIENLKQKFAVSQCELNALTQATSSNVDEVCEKVEGLTIDTATYSDPDISHISYSEKCDEWWCPKHSDFNEILKKISLKEQSVEDRYLVRKAKARHTYWQGEKNKNTPRCPMQDNKKGTPNRYQAPTFWPSPLQQ